MEWVEIIEPRTKEHMYANLTTGECVWDPPPGVRIKKTTDNQWWELFDHKTSRFYYYNAATQRTVWHRPQNCDIIPLAKLQTLKQNTEVRPGAEKSTVADESRSSAAPKKESVSTQTPSRFAQASNGSRRTSERSASAAQTSPSASPRPQRRHHHHHHHHQHHSNSNSSSSTTTTTTTKELQVSQGSQACFSSTGTQSGRYSDEDTPLAGAPLSRKSRRGSHSSQLSWYSRQGRSQDSGRSSDSSSLSLSTGSAKRDAEKIQKLKKVASSSLASPSHSGRRLDMATPHFGSTGTPLAGRKSHLSSPLRSLELSRQRSFDSENSSLATPTRAKPSELFCKEGSLSRSLSFMQKRTEPRGHAHYFDLWSPQHLPSESMTGVDSLCTPLLHRKQRSWENKISAQASCKPKRVEANSSLGSDSSPSPRSPKRELLPADSGLSTLNELEKERETSVALLRSADSSPHSAGDSGLATTGSRASQGSSTKGKTATKERPVEPLASSSEATPTFDPTPLYSNIDYNYYLDPNAQAHLLPLQQYILEQAKLSGYRFGDPLAEEADSVHSDDSLERNRSGRGALGCRGNDDDSDDFADDEGMSNVEDSSSQEYLDDSHYLEEDDHYTQFLVPPVPPQRLESRGVVSPGKVIVESEYSEADPGLPRAGACSTLRSYAKAGGMSPPMDLRPVGHSSLKTRKEQASLYSPVLDKRNPFGDTFRSIPSSSSTNEASKLQTCSLQRLPSTTQMGKPPGEGDIEKYAQDNLNIHKKGIFRKNVSIRDMLSWSKDPIRKPMLPLEDKTLKKEACEVFKSVQIYMGDRKCKPGMTLNSVAFDICNSAWNKPSLRDELFLHICRQTTENPRKESLRRGWELMAICLYFFPPSRKLEPFLDGYINRHRDPGLNFTEVDKWPIHVQVSHYATVSCRRLLRIGAAGRRQERKPTMEEIEQARLQIFRPSMFGNTLEEIMIVQRDRFPHRKLPWVQTTLSEEVLRLQGAQTEGIFRVPADVDEVNSLKVRMDQWEVGQASDAHVPASLLKLWYRELYEPLIPDHLYEECVSNCNDPETAVRVVHRLPEINRLVLSYLIRFLQIFSQPEVSSITKMDASNLAMVMAPNCLRCTSTDPKTIFENTRKEMSFIRTLIQHLDTSFMEGVV